MPILRSGTWHSRYRTNVDVTAAQRSKAAGGVDINSAPVAVAAKFAKFQNLETYRDQKTLETLKNALNSTFSRVSSVCLC